MKSPDLHESLPPHHNNIGFLRLLFACAVIVAHAPELIGRNDLVSSIFGTWASFGTIAVDFFFVVSGFLITESFLKDPRLGAYLLRRIARIYPGFCVAFVISLVVFGPLLGGQMSTLFSPPPSCGINSSIWPLSKSPA